jgi:ABC-2 type transport system permease protein
LIRLIIAGAKLQAVMLCRSPADLVSLLAAPLFTLVFVAIILHAGRSDLVGYAVLGPTVIAIWSMALNVSGNLIESDRQDGLIEPTIATPGQLAPLVSGRILTNTLVSLLALPESMLIVRYALAIPLHVRHILLLTITMLVTAVATTATATALSVVFFIARSARIFQNSMSYPFYILSGAVVPTNLLPNWLHPLTEAVFLSWAVGLMRDSLTEVNIADPIYRLVMLTALGALAYCLGLCLMASTLRKMRNEGTAGHA